MGYAAKGVALLLVGLLVVIATVKAHPRNQRVDGGLKALRQQPFGIYMLAAVGIGLICYNVEVVRAKLAKMSDGGATTVRPPVPLGARDLRCLRPPSRRRASFPKGIL